MRLDRLRLVSLSPEVLAALPSLTHLYLQHNRLTNMSALAALTCLKFLTLAFNSISQVR